MVFVSFLYFMTSRSSADGFNLRLTLPSLLEQTWTLSLRFPFTPWSFMALQNHAELSMICVRCSSRLIRSLPKGEG